jgi:hypothetical protein
MTVVAMPTVMAVPAVVTVPATVPVHVGGRLLGILLDRGRSAGAGERERLRALGRCGYYEQCANSRKPQNFSHLHNSFPWSMDVTSATNGSLRIKPTLPQRRSQRDSG